MSRARVNVDIGTWAAPLAVAVMLFALYWWTLAPSISELHDNVDGAELIVVADALGVAHPPGSAIWLPLGKAALEGFAFIEEPARRTNLLSAFCMAAAGALIALTARRWRPETPAWAAMLAGILAGVAPIPWSQGIVTEMLALQALLTAAALAFATDAAQGRRWPLFALVLGLMAWNHPTGLALAIPLGIVTGIAGRPDRRALGVSAVIFALPGAFTVAYLMARADVPVSWGDTSTIGGVWEHLSGRVYQVGIERCPGNILAAVPETLRRALRQVPPPAWVLAPIGALALVQARPAFAAALVAACLLLTLFVSGYLATGRQDYLATIAFVLALLAAWGADEAWTSTRRYTADRGVALGSAVLLWGLVAVWVVVNGSNVSRRGDTTLRDAAVTTLEAAAPGSTILSNDDFDTFPLWYAREALGVRPDVGIEDVRGLAPVLEATP